MKKDSNPMLVVLYILVAAILTGGCLLVLLIQSL